VSVAAPATASSAVDGDDRERTAQAMRALLDANRTRMEKADIKRKFRDGALTLADLAAERPVPLRPVPLFALLLELPGFGRRRLDTVNRRAITDGINLARTLGEASASTLDWLVRAVDGQFDDDGPTTPAAAARVVDQVRPARSARRRPLLGVVGSYRASGGQWRRLVLDTADDETPVLIDRCGNDERVVERFRATAGLLEVAAVAGGYLAEARRLGRPMVAAAPKEQSR
jgi:hypothetical protein